MIVYMVTNKINNKKYIGQTVQTFAKRKARHLCNARVGIKGLFYNAIRKYGADAFSWEVLCRTDSIEELNARERYFIAAYETLCYKRKGYNIDIGGGNNKRTLSTRKKMSEAHKGITHTTETRKKLSEAHTGRKHTIEARMNMSKARKGITHTAKYRAKNSAAQKGRKHTAEARKKMSEAQKGKKHTVEHCANMRTPKDKTIHAFKHKDYGLAFCPQYELRKEFSLNPGNVSSLIRGEYKTTGGWSLASPEYLQKLKERSKTC